VAECQATQRDREEALRRAIQNLCNRMDRHQGKSFGTWNTKAFNEAQRYRPREDLSEQDLLAVWKWCCDQASRIGLRRE
jgi:hypothetical protein